MELPVVTACIMKYSTQLLFRGAVKFFDTYLQHTYLLIESLFETPADLNHNLIPCVTYFAYQEARYNHRKVEKRKTGHIINYSV